MLEPSIQLTRERVYGHVEGTPIPHELTAVCWLDGAGPQLNATLSKDQLDIDKLLKF